MEGAHGEHAALLLALPSTLSLSFVIAREGAVACTPHVQVRYGSTQCPVLLMAYAVPLACVPSFPLLQVMSALTNLHAQARLHLFGCAANEV